MKEKWKKQQNETASSQKGEEARVNASDDAFGFSGGNWYLVGDYVKCGVDC